MNCRNDKNKDENKRTVLSVVATGPFCAVIGFIIGKYWCGVLGGLAGLAVGYAYGVYFRKWVYGKNEEDHEE